MGLYVTIINLEIGVKEMKVPNETNGINVGVNPNTRISTCIPRCEKGISSIRKMKSRMQFNGSEKTLDDSISIRNAFTAREVNLENSLITSKSKLEKNIQNRDSSLKYLHAVDYLHLIESHIPGELVSSKNFDEIKNLANHFTGGLTSFFGFESRLSDSKARSDYLFAVSSMKGEREALLNLIKNGNLPKPFHNKSEWKQICNFATAWADSKSILHDNVLGLWFEFDTSSHSSEMPIPNIFLQIKKLRIETPEDIKKLSWITHIALPLLTGQHLSKKMEKGLIRSIQQLPEGTSVIHVGTMLKREVSGIRIVINRIKPEQIIPYLKSLGWSDETEELSLLLEELENYVSRMILHINVGEDVGSRIGLECSFSKDQYHQETGWSNFLNYLSEKKLCLPEKKSALLNFLGAEQENTNQDFDSESYIPSVMIPDNNFSSALVRYISHIKIVYEPNNPLEVKAYPGVRLFGLPQKSIRK